MEKEAEKKPHEYRNWCYGCCGSNFWGWAFIIIGGYFIARDLGWIPGDFPFWPAVLVLLGVYFLAPRRRGQY